MRIPVIDNKLSEARLEKCTPPTGGDKSQA